VPVHGSGTKNGAYSDRGSEAICFALAGEARWLGTPPPPPLTGVLSQRIVFGVTQGTPEGTYTDEGKEGSAKARTERLEDTHTALEAGGAGLINTKHQHARCEARGNSRADCICTHGGQRGGHNDRHIRGVTTAGN
jgi:hypothetical protein